MKIILTAAVSNLGKVGDVVEVKNGYAKNFLIPSKKAICLTVNNQKIFESKKQEFEQENQKDLETAKSVQELISGKDINIIENASDDGRLYGSVSSADIAAKINDLVNQKVASRVNVALKKPIKEVGIYVAKLSLHSEIVIDVRLVIARSDSEIASLLKAEKEEKKAAEEEKRRAAAPKAKAKEEVAPEASEVAEETSEEKTEESAS